MSWIAPYQVRAERRYRAQTQALAAPMALVPWVGDSRLVTDRGAPNLDPVERLLCLYAAAVLAKRGVLPIDASGFDARVLPPSTVVFTRADAGQAETCKLTIEVGD